MKYEDGEQVCYADGSGQGVVLGTTEEGLIWVEWQDEHFGNREEDNELDEIRRITPMDNLL